LMLFPRLVSKSEASYGNKVLVLPPEVAHRIAAGEVIERPASAVKEIVENALDAGASRVEVEIENGGISLIRVRDDGSGMSPEDAERSVGRHATKIHSAEDLARGVS
jgi:DNA mismatch repair protein MutL